MAHEKTIAMVQTQAIILTTLKSINEKIQDVKESVRETKGQVKDTANRVWQIGLDVRTLKQTIN